MDAECTEHLEISQTRFYCFCVAFRYVRTKLHPLDPNHHMVGKRATQQLERKHLTLRTRIKRLVRKTICFSKSVQMHDLIIGLFINRFPHTLLPPERVSSQRGIVTGSVRSRAK
jgi:insertion element IS1 protein InsB